MEMDLARGLEAFVRAYASDSFEDITEEQIAAILGEFGVYLSDPKWIAEKTGPDTPVFGYVKRLEDLAKTLTEGGIEARVSMMLAIMFIAMVGDDDWLMNVIIKRMQGDEEMQAAKKASNNPDG